jgi:hypothetical protein
VFSVIDDYHHFAVYLGYRYSALTLRLSGIFCYFALLIEEFGIVVLTFMCDRCLDAKISDEAQRINLEDYGVLILKRLTFSQGTLSASLWHKITIQLRLESDEK